MKLLNQATDLKVMCFFQLGNHDVPRVASRFGPEIAQLLIMITMLLPGTNVSYYGEEIGMEDMELSWEQTVDPAGRNAGENKFRNYSRDPERTPMQWNGDENGGRNHFKHILSFALTPWQPYSLTTGFAFLRVHNGEESMAPHEQELSFSERCFPDPFREQQFTELQKTRVLEKIIMLPFRIITAKIAKAGKRSGILEVNITLIHC